MHKEMQVLHMQKFPVNFGASEEEFISECFPTRTNFIATFLFFIIYWRTSSLYEEDSEPSEQDFHFFIKIYCHSWSRWKEQ